MSDKNVIEFPGATRWLPASANDDDAGLPVEPAERVGVTTLLMYALRANAGGIVVSVVVCAALWYLRG